MSKRCLLYSIAIVAHLAALLTSVALCYMYATTIWREDHGKVGENNLEKITNSKLDCFGKLISLEKHIQNTLLLLVEGGMFYEVATKYMKMVMHGLGNQLVPIVRVVREHMGI